LGIGVWGLGIGPNPQSPIPNPQFNNYFYEGLIVISFIYFLMALKFL